MTPKIRWSGIGLAAAMLVVSAGGCASQKLKTERAQLLQQNAQLQQQLTQTKASLSAAQAQLQQQQAATAAAEAQAQQAQQAAQAQPAPASGMNTVMPGFKNGGKAGHGKSGMAMRSHHGTHRRMAGHRRSEMHRFVLSSDVLFASGSARLMPRSTHALMHVVYMIKRHYAGRYIRIEGFTDNRPIHHRFKNNYELGLARARSVESFLARHGISRHWMRAISYGSHDLVSRTNLALDRRVEIVILR